MLHSRTLSVPMNVCSADITLYITSVVWVTVDDSRIAVYKRVAL